jgi:hypothetical protein
MVVLIYNDTNLLDFYHINYIGFSNGSITAQPGLPDPEGVTNISVAQRHAVI